MYHIYKHIRFIFREFRITAMLNIIGLVLAFMTFYSFWARLREQVAWDTCHDQWQAIYRVELEGNFLGEDSLHFASVPAKMIPEICNVPEVQGVGVQQVWSRTVSLRQSESIIEMPYNKGFGRRLSFWRNDSVFSACKDFTVVQGDTILNALIPLSFAKEFFGDKNPVGKKLSFTMEGNEETRVVAGVYDDFPSNCSVLNAIYDVSDSKDIYNGSNYSYNLYLKIPDPRNIAKVEKELEKVFLNTCDYALPEENSMFRVQLRSLHEAYFSGVDKTKDKGSYIFIVIIFMAAQLPLALAYINFVYFQMAVAPYTIKTKNTHRIFGASKFRVVFNQVAENVILVAIAFLVAMGLVFLIDRNNELGLSPFENLLLVGYTLIAAALLTLFATITPTIYTSSVPLDISMKGVPAITLAVKRTRVAKLLFQMVTSFVIVGFALSLMFYFSYIKYGDYGYEKSEVVFGKISASLSSEKKEQMARELMTQPDILNVSYSAFPLGGEDSYLRLSVATGDSSLLLFTILPADHRFLSTLGIRIAEGRNFSPNDRNVVILNKAAAERYPSLRVGENLMINGKNTIIGICENLRISSLREDNENNPVAFIVVDSVRSPAGTEVRNNVMTIRIAPTCRNRDELQKNILNVYRRYTSSTELLTFDSPDKRLSIMYRNEYRFFVEVSILCAVYVFITLIGILSQAMFEIQFRRREIFIRRVYGATILQILKIRIIWCVKYLTLAFAISLPFIYLLSTFALQDYFGRPKYLWLVYPLTYLVVALLMLSTIFIHGIYSLRGKVYKM